jgi:hypothetical protein
MTTPLETPNAEIQPAEVYMRQVLTQIDSDVKSGALSNTLHPSDFNGKGEEHGVTIITHRDGDLLTSAEVSMHDFTPNADPDQYSNLDAEYLEIEMRYAPTPVIRLTSQEVKNYGTNRQEVRWIKLMTTDGVITHLHTSPETNNQQVVQAKFSPTEAGYAKARAELEDDINSFLDDTKRKQAEVLQMRSQALQDQARRN